MKFIQAAVTFAVLISYVVGQPDKAGALLLGQSLHASSHDESTRPLTSDNDHESYPRRLRLRGNMITSKGYKGKESNTSGTSSSGSGSTTSKSSKGGYRGEKKGSPKGLKGKTSVDPRTWYNMHKRNGRKKRRNRPRPGRNPTHPSAGSSSTSQHVTSPSTTAATLVSSSSSQEETTTKSTTVASSSTQPAAMMTTSSIDVATTTTTTTPQQTTSSCRQKDLDVCIAIDRSGSICTPSGGPFISCSGNPDCGCDNFDRVRQFTNNLIKETSEASQTKWGIVAFASSARVITPLTSPLEAINAVELFRYTGGWTATGSALELCQNKLKNSTSERIIILLTDGTPTRPDPNLSGSPFAEARDYATEQANSAKEDDITLITVFVNTATGTSSYLKSLASPGYYVEAADFNELGDTADLLLDLVECV